MMVLLCPGFSEASRKVICFFILNYPIARPTM